MATQTRIITFPANLSAKTLQAIIDLFVTHKWLVPEKYGKLSTSDPLPSPLTPAAYKELYNFYEDNPSLLIYGKKKKFLDFVKPKKGQPFSAQIIHSNDGADHADIQSSGYDAAIAQVMQWTNAVFAESQDRANREHYLYRYEKSGDAEVRVMTIKNPGEGLTHAAWKMWFSERYVKAIGKEKLLSAPAHAIKEFGTIIFVNVFKDPAKWKSVEALKAVDDFKTHVGYDFFYDQEEPGKRLRTPDFSDL